MIATVRVLVLSIVCLVTVAATARPPIELPTLTTSGPAYDRAAAFIEKHFGDEAELMGIRPDGRPEVLRVDLLHTADAVGARAVWPGGRSGLGLTGALRPKDVAVWDNGLALSTHEELAGKIIAGDATGVGDHATSVTGIIVGAGVSSWLRGMAYQGQVTSYDWWGDADEMALAAADSLRLSNLSYGTFIGWEWGDSTYTWLGDIRFSELEDVEFGRYNSLAAFWDQLACEYPRYLICKSAGNDRGIYGPPDGGVYWLFNPETGQMEQSTVPRPANGYPGGYDSLQPRNTAKNILTVGAASRIQDADPQVEEIGVMWYSSWGPTDDGRIKPDLVAPGDDVYTTAAESNTAYDVFGGTSAASPLVCGAQALLLQQHRQLHPGAPDLLASTRKALLLHTAREAGSYPGPDYSFGWGLLDVEAAALLQTRQPGSRGVSWNARCSPARPIR